MYDVLIIGAGPAGLGAAIYGVRAGLHIAVIDRSQISGGQVLTTYEVDNYLGLPGVSGSDMSDRFRQHADKLEVSFLTANVLSLEDKQTSKIVHTEEGDYETKTIILATGASHAMLGVEGEMKLAGMGVSYCATCDGAFFKNRQVAVVGGSDVAVEDAIFLAGICKKVYVIHRRNQLRAAKSLQKKLEEFSNVEMLWNTEVKKIEGEDAVEAVCLYENQKKAESRLEVDGIFIAVGTIPNTDFCKDFVETDEKGYIIADESCKTSRAGVFAAGDIRTKSLRQIITAVSDGANSIHSVQSFFVG